MHPDRRRQAADRLERFGERAVGQLPLLLVGGSHQHDAAAPAHASRDLAGQPRLADTSFSSQEEQPTLALEQRVDGIFQRVELGVSADRHRVVGSVPNHRSRRHRSRRCQTASQELLVQALAGRRRVDIQLAPQCAPQELVLTQRLVPLADLGVGSHQGDVRLFVGRIIHHDLAQRVDRGARVAGRDAERRQLAEQPEVRTVQRIPARRRPVLVPILGQQLAGVAVERRLVDERVARGAGACRRLLEGLHVHPDRLLTLEHQRIPAQVEVGRRLRRTELRLERAPRGVDRLVQVVCRRLGMLLRPERVHELLALELVPRRQGEQLDQVLRLAEPPVGVVDRSRADGDPKPAEQMDEQRLGRAGDLHSANARSPCARIQWRPAPGRHPGPSAVEADVLPLSPTPRGAGVSAPLAALLENDETTVHGNAPVRPDRAAPPVSARPAVLSCAGIPSRIPKSPCTRTRTAQHFRPHVRARAARQPDAVRRDRWRRRRRSARGCSAPGAAGCPRRAGRRCAPRSPAPRQWRGSCSPAPRAARPRAAAP